MAGPEQRAVQRHRLHRHLHVLPEGQPVTDHQAYLIRSEKLVPGLGVDGPDILAVFALQPLAILTTGATASLLLLHEGGEVPEGAVGVGHPAVVVVGRDDPRQGAWVEASEPYPGDVV